jgi:hypothetical protein
MPGVQTPLSVRLSTAASRSLRIRSVRPAASIAAQGGVRAHPVAIHRKTEGFVLSEDGTRPIVAVDDISRDAQGLFSCCELTMADSDTVMLLDHGRARSQPGGRDRVSPASSALRR